MLYFCYIFIIKINMETNTLLLLREVETYIKLQSKLANHMKEGFVDMARAKITAGRKFQFGSRFVPPIVNSSSKVFVHPTTKKLYSAEPTATTTTTTTSSAAANNNINRSASQLRNRKLSTSQEQKASAAAQTIIVRDPSLLFGSLSPPTLKSCSKSFKSIVQLSIELAQCKQRIVALTCNVKVPTIT